MSYQAAPPPARAGATTRVIEPTQLKQALKPKTKYRDPLLEDESANARVTANIMFDPRVARGSTAGRTAVIMASAAAAPSATRSPASKSKRSDQLSATLALTRPRGLDPHARTTSSPSKRALTRPSKSELVAQGKIRPKQPSVAAIHSQLAVVRKKVPVPTHLYLVEQKEATLVSDVSEQTDEMMAEPPSPPYVPRKTGVDTGTQVENSMVFTFDEDVAPLIEVVTSKILEQSLMEVREEEDLSRLDARASELQAKYESEVMRGQAFEMEEQQKFMAKEERIRRAREQAKAMYTLRSKIAATYFSRRYMGQLQSSVLERLELEGFFPKDALAREVEGSVLPGLVADAQTHVVGLTSTRSTVQSILSLAVQQLSKQVAASIQRRDQQEAERLAREKAEKLAKEEAARRARPIELFIHTALVPEHANPVGPIRLTGNSTLRQIEERVLKWMENYYEENQPRDENTGEALEMPRREYMHFAWNGVRLDGTKKREEEEQPPPSAAAADTTEEQTEEQQGEEEEESKEDEEAAQDQATSPTASPSGSPSAPPSSRSTSSQRSSDADADADDEAASTAAAAVPAESSSSASSTILDTPLYDLGLHTELATLTLEYDPPPPPKPAPAEGEGEGEGGGDEEKEEGEDDEGEEEEEEEEEDDV